MSKPQQLGFDFDAILQEQETAHLPGTMEEAIPYYRNLIERVLYERVVMQSTGIIPRVYNDSNLAESQLAASWPAERLIAIWNSLPGVEPVTTFKTAKASATKIWESIQGLGKAAEPAKPKADKKAKGGAKSAKGAPAKGKPTKKATPAKSAPKAKNRPRAKRIPRANAEVARPPKWWRCCNARTAPRCPRSWKRWTGRSRRSAGSWPAR